MSLLERPIEGRVTRRARLATLALLIGGSAMTGRGGGAPNVATATTPAGTVRPPALAGSWYPGSPALLLATARSLMRQASAGPMPYGRPVALAVPHAGWAYSGTVAAAAFRILTPGSFTRVVVMAPSHHAAFAGYALEDAVAYRTPLGEIPLARGALRDLETPGLARVVPGATGSEHAVEIELPFLQAALGSFTLVPILAGRVDATAEKAFAGKLARLDDGKTLFVFSSDFTHYGPRFGYMPFG
ncbi:MAG: AmmeMemoRadiSam system protein B, partial [Acidithiobacillales bacterium]